MSYQPTAPSSSDSPYANCSHDAWRTAAGPASVQSGCPAVACHRQWHSEKRNLRRHLGQIDHCRHTKERARASCEQLRHLGSRVAADESHARDRNRRLSGPTRTRRVAALAPGSLGFAQSRSSPAATQKRDLRKPRSEHPNSPAKRSLSCPGPRGSDHSYGDVPTALIQTFNCLLTTAVRGRRDYLGLPPAGGRTASRQECAGGAGNALRAQWRYPHRVSGPRGGAV